MWKEIFDHVTKQLHHKTNEMVEVFNEFENICKGNYYVFVLVKLNVKRKSNFFDFSLNFECRGGASTRSGQVRRNKYIKSPFFPILVTLVHYKPFKSGPAWGYPSIEFIIF